VKNVKAVTENYYKNYVFYLRSHSRGVCI